jgi:hypothetical protein
LSGQVRRACRSLVADASARASWGGRPCPSDRPRSRGRRASRARLAR